MVVTFSPIPRVPSSDIHISCYAQTVVHSMLGIYIPVYVVCVDVADQFVQVLTLGFAASPLADIIVGLFNRRITVVYLHNKREKRERENREREKGEIDVLKDQTIRGCL
jgi:hypothetical protein